MRRNVAARRAFGVSLALVTALPLGGCVQYITPPGPAPLRYRDVIFTSAVETSDITYGSAADINGHTVTLLLDLYTPPASDTVHSRPAIVWVHGGGFGGGSKTAPELIDQATTFSRKGYVNVSIDYRLTPQSCALGPSPRCTTAMQYAQYDAMAAIRYLRANASSLGVDVNRIAIGGTSAGAITALNVAYNPTDVGTSGNPGFSSAVQAATSLSGSLQLGQPDKGEPPSLLFHGTADTQVPYALAVATQNAALAVGVLCLITAWEGDGHVPYAKHRKEIIDQTTNFLYWELHL